MGTSPAYGCSAQVAEVSVDMETGHITVERVVDAHDCGRAINRLSVEGQMEGSVFMGLGEALFEEVKFDDRGRVINADFILALAAQIGVKIGAATLNSVFFRRKGDRLETPGEIVYRVSSDGLSAHYKKELNKIAEGLSKMGIRCRGKPVRVELRE